MVDRSRGGPLAVVLSGGGAKGLAHIGVLRVLDSLGVEPDLVVGTSMGALIGALYSSGLSGVQVDSVARRIPLEGLFDRYPPTPIITGGDLTNPVPVVVPSIGLEERARGWQFQSPAARGAQVNALLNQLLLRANVAAGGDFDRLPRSFRAVATDLHTRASVVLREGDLAQAVRASVAIPLVFTPVRRDGQVLIDGGISANVPAALARREGAVRLLISDVGTIPGAEMDVESTTAMLAYVLDLLFSQRADSLGASDVLIRPTVRGFTTLDFSPSTVNRLIDAGYSATAAALRGCRILPSERITPVLARSAEPLIADRLARLAEAQVYESVWLNPRRSGSPTDTAESAITFATVAVPGPRRFAGLGLSFDDHDGARVWGNATMPGLAGGRLSVGALVSLGEWRQVVLLRASGVRRHPVARVGAPVTDSGAIGLPDPRSNEPPWSTLTRDRIRPELSLTASHDIVRFFDPTGRELARPSTNDLVLFAGASASAGRFHAAVGPLAHLWFARGTEGPEEQQQAGGALVRLAHLLPNPNRGFDRAVTPMVVAESFWLGDYRRADFQATVRLPVGSLTAWPRGATGWGERLPLSGLLILGGPQGFPGLPIGSRRGDRRTFGAVAAAHPIAGPIFAWGEVGRGTTTMRGDSRIVIDPLVATGWVNGAELGLAADTPVGPLIVTYGVATGGQRGVKLRLGIF